MTFKKTLNVFQRLIVLFLFMILPVTVISALIITSNRRSLENQLLDSTYSSVSNFSSSFDKDIELLATSMKNLSVNSKVDKLCYQSEIISKFELSQNINSVRELITQMKETHSFIYNIKLYIHPLLRAYNAAGYEHGSVQVVSEEDYSSLISLRSQCTPLVLRGNSLYLIYYASISDTRSIIEAEFDLRKLGNHFIENAPENSYYLYSFEDRNIITSNISDTALLSQLTSFSPDTDAIREVTYHDEIYYAFTTNLPVSGTNYTVLVPNRQLLEPLQVYTFILTGYILISLICIAFFLYGCNKIIHKPLKKLIFAFSAVEVGNFDVRIPTDGSEDFSYLYHHFNDMTEKLDELITQNYHQTLLLQKAELKQLQSQINPHFLYNSFFMLHRMILSGMQEESENVSKMLGQYFKYITYNHQDLIPLKSEYEHAKVYSTIQALRFDGRIEVYFESLPAAFDQLLVPKLILQPLLENAFSYGLENKENNGILRVRFAPEENKIKIIVEDNGNDLTDQTLSAITKNMSEMNGLDTSTEITALFNIYRRIRIYSDKQSTMTVDRSELGGMRVSISLCL